MIRNIVVQQAKAEHVTVLASLHAACFDETEQWDARSIGSLMQMPGTLVWMTGCEQRPTGFLMIRICHDEAEILTLCVLPSQQRQGVARALLTESKKNLYEKQVISLFLEVSVNNIRAKSLYTSEGFASISERRSYYPDGSDATVMRYDLRIVRR